MWVSRLKDTLLSVPPTGGTPGGVATPVGWGWGLQIESTVSLCSAGTFDLEQVKHPTFFFS